MIPAIAAAAWGVIQRNRDLVAVLMLILGAGAGAWGIAHWYSGQLRTAEQRGRDAVEARAARKAQEYESQLARLQARKDSVVRIVDTITLRTDSTSKRVREAVAAVPDSLAAVPEVATLKAAALLLTYRVDSLKAVRIIERQAFESIHALDSSTIRASMISLAARGDSIIAITRQRDARVTKPKVVIIASTAAGVGYAIAQWVVPLFRKD